MARQGVVQAVVLSNLIATCSWISWNFETSFAIERPIHLSFCALLLAGVIWSTFGRWDKPVIRKDEETLGKRPQLQLDIPILAQHQVSRALYNFFHIGNLSGICSTFLVATIVLRAVLLGVIVFKVQCSWDGVELCLPFILALFELFTSPARTRPKSPFQVLPASARFYSLRYVVLVAAWVLPIFSVIAISVRSSTFICPSSSSLSGIVLMVQCIGLFLDAYVIITVSKMAKGLDSAESWRSLGQLALSSSAVLGILGLIFLWKNPENFRWSSSLDFHTMVDLLFAGLLCANFSGCAIYLMRELRLTTIFIVASCASVYFYTLKHQVTDLSGGHRGIFVSVSLITLGSIGALIQLEKETYRSQPHLSLNRNSSRTLFSMCMLILLSFTITGTRMILQPSPNIWSIHPANTLISNARSTSGQWMNQATKSKSLGEAIAEYRRRYKINPPTNFERWYDFAISRGSIIIDDFDQIHNDLLPFWGIKPSKIREITGYMLERPWTDVGGLRIANKTTTLSPHMVPTHRWMVEGAATMINTFAEWLPDMDLALNLNDESRVAVPWLDMEKLLQSANSARKNLQESQIIPSFSVNTPGTWKNNFMDTEPPYPPNEPSAFFSEASSVDSFDNYGTIGCSPDSLARRWKWWNKKYFCQSCASPHSLGPFLSNWALSGSLCHQPDIANLHGFHLSPSAFKPTRMLFPIFSQSKIPTFSDIMFPSPWNYMDKVIYNESMDIPFSQKEDTLFWRGATSEGFSLRNTWEGMQRQRFVHLANHTSKTTTVSLLLPESTHSTVYQQKNVPLSNILAKTNVNVSFVGEATRCYTDDCTAQEREFHFSGPVDFQEHWQYKYLIDLDGAGFSGRFLPFLQSRSLVFRAAGFRQWFDERLTAWKHFVPVDGRLHGVWDLLAYFGGTAGRNGEVEHTREGEKIAEDGREWARKVLRREDMEVYMFRLLLEWGRIVDDKRDQIGFVMPD